jgi:hypothetical protein
MRKNPLWVLAILTLSFLALSVPAMAEHTKGVFSQIPAYYDAKLFTITFTELPSGGEAAVLKRNKSINIIYQSDQAEQCNTPVTSVIDAIPGPGEGPGFNPLWQEVQITYLGGCGSVVQFKSDNEILSQVGITIALTPTTEIYTCSVVGPGPK